MTAPVQLPDDGDPRVESVIPVPAAPAGDGDAAPSRPEKAPRAPRKTPPRAPATDDTTPRKKASGTTGKKTPASDATKASASSAKKASGAAAAKKPSGATAAKRKPAGTTSAAQRPATPRTSGVKTPAKTSASAMSAAAPRDAVVEPVGASPGPPPPLPADVLVPDDLVIPPKPPLPPVTEPPAEPVDIEPESDADTVAAIVEDEPADDVLPADALAHVLEDVQPDAEPALTLRGVTKRFGGARAVDGIDLTVPAGSFYGIVGPNGAGKTTTLSMIAGLLRPDAGSITVNGIDARAHAQRAKRLMGVLPDRLRTFDRLTGRQLLYYYGVLRGLPSAVVESRISDLARAFDLVDALGRSVSDYSAGMTKKVMLAGAMIHSPRLLVLDEPFESVDPVSSTVILDILSTYVQHGGTVILSSHGMELVERVCSRVAVLVSGQVLAEGTVDEVRGTGTLQERFLELAGGGGDQEGLEWLHTFSD